MDKRFVFKTTSRSMLETVGEDVRDIQLYNFAEGTHKFSLHGRVNNRIGAFDSTWIRIWNKKREYFDFITSSIFFVENKEGILMLTDEDIEFLDLNFFAREVDKTIEGAKLKSNEEYLTDYIKDISSDMNNAFKELSSYYSLQKQIQSGRLKVEDEFALSKAALASMYLKNLVLKKVYKENKEEIMELMG